MGKIYHYPFRFFLITALSDSVRAGERADRYRLQREKHSGGFDAAPERLAKRCSHNSFIVTRLRLERMATRTIISRQNLPCCRFWDTFTTLPKASGRLQAFLAITDLVEKLRAQNVASGAIIPDEIHDLLRWSDWIRTYPGTAESRRRMAARAKPDS